MSQTTPAPADRFLALAACAVLAAVALFTLRDGVARASHIVEVSEGYGVAVDAPAADAGSPTGYADGRRSLVHSFGAADTAHWVMQTQESIARGEWRVRRVGYDNAPEGREVHWSAPFRWWLATIAWVDHLATGRPAGQSVERAALYSGPAMLVLLLAGAGALLLQRFSAPAAALFALGAVAVFPFYLDFVSGYADHHGLANICALLTVLFLVAPAGGGAHARHRRWFAASGIAGGFGLWISAATIVPVLFAIGSGFLASGWLSRRAPAGAPWIAEPGLLRTWGWAGGAASLAGWLVEYFPQHMGVRLEVNHPLYAAAWIGAGEVLRVAMLAMRDGPRAATRRDRLACGLGVAAAALPALVVALAPAQTFRLTDPLLWRIHSAHISEFQSLGGLLAKGLNRDTLALCLPVLLLAPPLWLAARKAAPPPLRATLVLALAPAVVAWAMGAGQVRWLGLAFAMSVPAVAVFLRGIECAAVRSRAALLAWTVAGAVVLAPGAANAVQRTMRAGESTRDEIRSLAVRDVAHWLRLRAGADRVVVAAAPTSTTSLIYHGSLSGVGTLYWENAAGLRNAAALFGAQSSGEARAVAERLGVTHIVFFSWEPFEPALARLHLGLAEDAPLPADTFATRLLSSPVPPPWLSPIPLKLPDHPSLAGSQMRLWEVTAPQQPATAIARAASYFLELGRPDDATRSVPLLERFGDELPAAVMLARVASQGRDPDAFSRALAGVAARIDRAGALALDEHVRLAAVLAAAEQPDRAQEQLRACMRKADERSVRGLTPGTLAELLALSDALAVPFPDPALRALAERLLPPDLRK